VVIKLYADLMRRIVRSSESWLNEMAPATIIAAMSRCSSPVPTGGNPYQSDIALGPGLHNGVGRDPAPDMGWDDSLWLVSLQCDGGRTVLWTDVGNAAAARLQGLMMDAFFDEFGTQNAGV
jgi:hypothetical protein